ncbi:PAS domain-containing sensor histidine kinase [Fundidesulfovibrio agrisoli]|uniref:PAS domain-containing sensor histidine kinase n=1 Tax=Fundidesulfovibrio agrisoli TaxID=2922717 RepID=UPI001FADB191
MPKKVNADLSLLAELEAARTRIAELEAERDAGKKAEEALRANEALLQAVLRDLPFDFWARDINHRVIMQSNESIRLWGDLSKVSVAESYCTSDTSKIWKDTNRRVLSGEVVTGEQEYATASGGLRTYQCIAAPIRDGDAILGIVGINLDITAHKKTEQALQDAHAFLNIVLNNLPDPIFVEDEQHRHVLVNHALSEQLGIPMDGFLGKTVRDIMPPELAESKWADTELVLNTGAVSTAEEQIIDAQGRLRDIITRKVPYKGSGGEKLVIGVTMDVTDRNRADEALRASEERYSTIVRTTAEGICILDKDNAVTFINQAMADMIGLEIAEAVGRPGSDFLFPEDLPNFNERLNQRLSGQSIRYERRLRKKDGSALWTIASTTPLFSKDGEFLGSFGMFTDITARKQAEAELARQKHMLLSIIESTSDAVFVKDGSGRYILVNNVTARLFGLSKEEMLGRADTDVFPPDQAEMLRKNDLAILALESPRTIEERLTTRDGNRIYLTTKGPLHNESGEKTGIFGIARDITEREQMAETLVQTEKMASVGGLAAGMAHEINNPLAGILQSAQVIATRLRPDNAANIRAAEKCGCPMPGLQCYLDNREILTLLDGVRDAGKRASLIVSNMLDFSKRHNSDLYPVNIIGVIEKSIELCQQDHNLAEKYNLRNVAIKREFESEECVVPCSGNQIQQVMLNLLRNALHAMSEAETPAPSITLRARIEGEHALIEVEDNGPGMEEHVRRRVFDPFFTTKAPNKGTGLGLSVSYFLVVNRHGGTLEVHSTPGKGTRFTIKLPLTPRYGKRLSITEPPVR